VLFAALVTTQVAHSIEEHVGHLWDVLPPARVVSDVFSNDPSRGFLAFNLGVMAFGAVCLVGPVARGWRAARPLTWGWSVAELLNGSGHLVLSLVRRGYFPGALTAPVLILFAVALMRDLRRVA
jgi:hypothetical protein